MHFKNWIKNKLPLCPLQKPLSVQCSSLQKGYLRGRATLFTPVPRIFQAVSGSPSSHLKIYQWICTSKPLLEGKLGRMYVKIYCVCTFFNATFFFSPPSLHYCSFVHSSTQFHVFEITRQLPRFSMYDITTDSSASQTSGRVTFSINDRPQRVSCHSQENIPCHVLGNNMLF